LWNNAGVENPGKLRIGVIFGGRSGEHEISLRSARSVVAAIDRGKYDITLIGIDHAGRWRLLAESEFATLTAGPPRALHGEGARISIPPVPAGADALPTASAAEAPPALDVVFPVLHGPYGEDGTIQGFLDLADLPYVGAGVLGSAVGMDKDVQKRLLRDAGLPLLPFVTLSRTQIDRAPDAPAEAARGLGYPVFVKPANLGSSVGVSKVDAPDALAAAVGLALAFDNKILIERGITAREIECAVLGNDDPQASIAGEIVANDGFYSYEAKYIDPDGAVLRIPAQIPDELAERVRTLAVRVFQVLDCAGMARVDFLLDRTSGELFVNELNSIPGFTTISMYPKLWEQSGLPYPELIDRLIALALERHAARRRLRKTYA
jgi:D-alanine-D-alanine ligase